MPLRVSGVLVKNGAFFFEMLWAGPIWAMPEDILMADSCCFSAKLAVKVVWRYVKAMLMGCWLEVSVFG